MPILPSVSAPTCAILIAGCFTAPAATPAAGPYPPPAVPDYATASAFARSMPAGETDAPVVAAKNPALGGTATAQRDVTPIGWRCSPGHAWTFALTKRGGKVCLDVVADQVRWRGKLSEFQATLDAQLRVDGVTTAVFPIALEGVASKLSDCTGSSSNGELWIARYKGCVAGSGLTKSAQRAEVLFPTTSGDTPFIAWTFAADGT